MRARECTHTHTRAQGPVGFRFQLLISEDVRTKYVRYYTADSRSRSGTGLAPVCVRVSQLPSSTVGHFKAVSLDLRNDRTTYVSFQNTTIMNNLRDKQEKLIPIHIAVPERQRQADLIAD